MANNSNIPFYRDPNDILVPAEVTTLLIGDFSFVNNVNPLPVYTDTPDPDMATNTPPIYISLAGVRVPADAYSILLSDGTFVGPGNPLPVTGGGGPTGPIDASDVTYTTPVHPAVENVQEALDLIFYVPVDVTSMSGGSSNEIGSTVHGVSLAWTINKAVTSQSLNQSIGSIDPTLRAYNYAPDITSDKTFTLTASDGTTSDNASTSVSFFRKRYWGAAADPDLKDDQAAIRALSQEFATNRNKAVTYNCSGGKYPYFIYPTSFGALTAVTVGGLAFTDFVQDTISFTNASGHTENYYVTRFNGIQTGSAINVVWG